MKETIVTADAHPLDVSIEQPKPPQINLEGMVPQLRELMPYLDAMKNAKTLCDRHPSIFYGSKLQDKRESFVRKLHTILKSLPMRESEFLEALRIKCPDIDEILGVALDGGQ